MKFSKHTHPKFRHSYPSFWSCVVKIEGTKQCTVKTKNEAENLSEVEISCFAKNEFVPPRWSSFRQFNIPFSYITCGPSIKKVIWYEMWQMCNSIGVWSRHMDYAILCISDSSLPQHALDSELYLGETMALNAFGWAYSLTRDKNHVPADDLSNKNQPRREWSEYFCKHRFHVWCQRPCLHSPTQRSVQSKLMP